MANNRNRSKSQRNVDRILHELSTLSEEVERLERIKSQLGNANQDLVRRLQEKEREYQKLVETLSKAIEALKAIRELPNYYANFLHFVDQEKKVADIIFNGQRKRVGVDIEINRAELVWGTSVIISGETAAIIGMDTNPDKAGVVVTVKKYVSDNAVLVEDNHGGKNVAYFSNHLNKQEAAPGSKVLVSGSFVIGVVESEDDSIRQATSQYLLAEVPDVDFDDIGGLDKEVETIRKEIEDSFEVPRLYDLYSIPKESHVLLHGLPGNGKTMLAKAIARGAYLKYKDRIKPHASGNFFTIRGPELESKWVGEDVRVLREVFDSATALAKKSQSPVFIFFDDCESFLLRRGAGVSSDVNMGNVTQFLTLMEGVKEIKGVNVILASNRIDVLDPAVVGRMRLKVRIKEPDKEAASKIFRKHLKKVPLHTKYKDREQFPNLGDGEEQVLEYVVGLVIERLYNDSKDNNFMEIVFQDDSSEIIKIHQLVSGRIIRDIVDRAKKIAKDRDKTLPESTWPGGVSAEDVLEALELEFKSSEALPTTKETVQEWLKQKGITKVVEYSRKLFGEKAGERRVDYPVQ